MKRKKSPPRVGDFFSGQTVKILLKYFHEKNEGEDFK